MTRIANAALLICLSVIWVNAVVKVATYVNTNSTAQVINTK